MKVLLTIVVVLALAVREKFLQLTSMVFFTLFAIKLPGGEYREHTETISLNVLMSRAAMEITGQHQSEPGFGVIAEDAPFIYLSGQFPLLRQDIDIFALP